MLTFIRSLRGDKAIWGIVALLALFSFLPVYSASAHLAFRAGSTTSTVGYLVKHGVLMFLGFAIIYAIHKVPTHYFKGLSIIAMPIILPLLAYTLTVKTDIGGVEANRWVEIPLIGIDFQTSTLASLVLMIWIARYLSKMKNKPINFQESILPLWVPVILVIALILPGNFSTAAIVGFLVMILCFVGGYPLKYLLAITGVIVMGAIIFLTLLFNSPDKIGLDRAGTWKTRINTFFNPEQASDDAKRQPDNAKMAIVKGGLWGKGAGKSVMKNVISQSESDFIYAIIIEEYGLLGGGFLLFLYLFLLFRIVVVANSTTTIFAKLLVIGVGFPIVFQAFINMAVVVQLFPVTGQPLPLISMGGTSIWMTCLAIGIVLSASDKTQAVKRHVIISEEETNPLEVLSGQL